MPLIKCRLFTGHIHPECNASGSQAQLRRCVFPTVFVLRYKVMCVDSPYVCCKCFYVDCIMLGCVSGPDPLLLGYLCSNSTPTLTCSVNVPAQTPFVPSGQNLSFCRDRNNGLDQCVGSCSHVSQCCHVWKEMRLFTFHSSSPSWKLLSVSLTLMLHGADQQKRRTSWQEKLGRSR